MILKIRLMILSTCILGNMHYLSASFAPFIINRTDTNIVIAYKNGENDVFATPNTITITPNQMIIIPHKNIKIPGSNPEKSYTNDITGFQIYDATGKTALMDFYDFAKNFKNQINDKLLISLKISKDANNKYSASGKYITYDTTTGARKTGAGDADKIIAGTSGYEGF